MDRGRAGAREALAPVGLSVQARHAVDGTLRPSATATRAAREAPCSALPQAGQSSADPVAQHCATMRSGFAPGVWGGGETAELPTDHVDVERWVKGPKGPERRIHGPGHAGGRIVRHGPTLMLALDAPVPHDGPLTVDALAPSGHARVPESQQQAVERGKMMRQARSRKQRPVLLADLAQRSLNAL